MRPGLISGAPNFPAIPRLTMLMTNDASYSEANEVLAGCQSPKLGYSKRGVGFNQAEKEENSTLSRES